MFQICQNESAGLDVALVACMRVPVCVLPKVRGVCCSELRES